MYKWIKSEEKWTRRLTVATVLYYIRARKTEPKACLELDEVMKEKIKMLKKRLVGL